jgi:hypothetical protein
MFRHFGDGGQLSFQGFFKFCRCIEVFSGHFSFPLAATLFETGAPSGWLDWESFLEVLTQLSKFIFPAADTAKPGSQGASMFAFYTHKIMPLYERSGEDGLSKFAPCPLLDALFTVDIVTCFEERAPALQQVFANCAGQNLAIPWTQFLRLCNDRLKLCQLAGVDGGPLSTAQLLWIFQECARGQPLTLHYTSFIESLFLCSQLGWDAQQSRSSQSKSADNQARVTVRLPACNGIPSQLTRFTLPSVAQAKSRLQLFFLHIDACMQGTHLNSNDPSVNDISSNFPQGRNVSGIVNNVGIPSASSASDYDGVGATQTVGKEDARVEDARLDDARRPRAHAQRSTPNALSSASPPPSYPYLPTSYNPSHNPQSTPQQSTPQPPMVWQRQQQRQPTGVGSADQPPYPGSGVARQRSPPLSQRHTNQSGQRQAAAGSSLFSPHSSSPALLQGPALRVANPVLLQRELAQALDVLFTYYSKGRGGSGGGSSSSPESSQAQHLDQLRFLRVLRDAQLLHNNLDFADARTIYLQVRV